MEKVNLKETQASITSVAELTKLQGESTQNAKLAADRLTQLKYLQADFDNLKKQCDKEKSECVKFANEELIRELLHVLDSFDQALEIDKNEGIKQLYQQFFSILEKNGLKKIDAIGKTFDPYYHEALIQEKSVYPEGTILEELQKGYLLNSKVIRSSKVKISGS